MSLQAETLMVSEPQLRAEIARVLVGDVRLDEFESWLARAGWNMHKYASPQLQALINVIQLPFAEHAKGHRRQDELLTLLRSIARPETTESPSAAAQVFP